MDKLCKGCVHQAFEPDDKDKDWGFCMNLQTRSIAEKYYKFLHGGIVKVPKDGSFSCQLTQTAYEDATGNCCPYYREDAGLVFARNYKTLLKTEAEVRERLGDGYHIENNVIKKIDVSIVPHFGNVISLDMLCENVCPYPLYNNTGNIGYIIRALVALLDLGLRDDGAALSEIRNVPIRIVFDGKEFGRAVAIGHYIEDRFVFIDELASFCSTKGGA